MAMNNPYKFVTSVSEELKGEFDDETKKNIPAHKITDKSDKYVYLGLSIGVVLGGIIVRDNLCSAEMAGFLDILRGHRRGSGGRIAGGADCLGSHEKQEQGLIPKYEYRNPYPSVAGPSVITTIQILGWCV